MAILVKIAQNLASLGIWVDFDQNCHFRWLSPLNFGYFRAQNRPKPRYARHLGRFWARKWLCCRLLRKARIRSPFRKVGSKAGFGPKIAQNLAALGIWVDFGPKTSIPAAFCRKLATLALRQNRAGMPFLTRNRPKPRYARHLGRFRAKKPKSPKCSLRSLFGDFGKIVIFYENDDFVDFLRKSTFSSKSVISTKRHIQHLPRNTHSYAVRAFACRRCMCTRYARLARYARSHFDENYVFVKMAIFYENREKRHFLRKCRFSVIFFENDDF